MRAISFAKTLPRGSRETSRKRSHSDSNAILPLERVRDIVPIIVYVRSFYDIASQEREEGNFLEGLSRRSIIRAFSNE